MNKQFRLYQGDNMESIKKLPDNSIDSIVTDPPYGLKICGKKWDYNVPSVEFWRECLRVLKPGGHVLSFGGTRTYHRMVINIEDAGFEIRDQIMWIYGSGFPKSMNIGKAVDKIQGNEREFSTWQKYHRNHNHSAMDEYARPNDVSKQNGFEVTKGTSPQEGWGTGLKPANEPICLARKPISEKTIADNMLKWGVGGINIDRCRIGSDRIKTTGRIRGGTYDIGLNNKEYSNTHDGRFPANIIFDEEAAEILDSQSGESTSQRGLMRMFDIKGGNLIGGGKDSDVITERGHNDSGGASRFFYVAKSSSKERNMGLGDDFEEKKYDLNRVQESGTLEERYNLKSKNNHPTIKPINLMTYLCRLITPPNGIVFDPFMGSGSTGISALLEGFRFVGMEMDSDYFKICESRIENYEQFRPLIKTNKTNG